MKKVLMTCLLLVGSLIAQAQGENNIWTFASQDNANEIVINFNSGAPQLAVPPNYTTQYSAAICYPNGQLRFTVRLTYNLPSSPYLPNIFNAGGNAVPNSNLLTGMLDESCMPVVIPHPGNPDQYYIFYSYSRGLLYSLLDMSLNNGNGGIVPGKKDVIIAPYGTINAQKMTAVKGCNGVWLVIYSRIANQILSYGVTTAGITTSPVVSTGGMLQATDYTFLQGVGYLKASSDGSRLAMTSYKGVELFDFEKCSGKVKNPRTLDTTGVPMPFLPLGAFNDNYFQGVCFSPDGSRLFVTWNSLDTFTTPSQIISGGYLLNGDDMVNPGKLFQYNLDLPTLQDIIASKTLIFINQPSIRSFFGQCFLVCQDPLGQIKAGPDEKLYIDNGSVTCLDPTNVPAGYNPGAGFHVINQPNLLGSACQPQFDVIVLDGFNNTYEHSFYSGRSYLQQDIVLAPPKPDTIPGQVYYPIACFKDTIMLTANGTGSCYLWDDSSTDQIRNIYQSGTYYVRYFKDCNITTDTFHVSLKGLPIVTAQNLNCPGMHLGKLVASAEDSFALNFVWRSQDGSILRQFSGANSDTLKGLEAGTYYVQISTSTGCDTIISGSIFDLPKPDVYATPIDTTVKYGDSFLLRATGALFYAWSPSGSLDTATKPDPIAKPLQPTQYAVIGIAENGCEDTAFVNVNIDYTMPNFVPNAFSPNGDGLNDVFGISNITYQKIIQFRIFNRFGQEVFSILGGHSGWDGSFKGRPCDIGTYYYFIVLDYPDGKRNTYKGDLQLLR